MQFAALRSSVRNPLARGSQRLGNDRRIPEYTDALAVRLAIGRLFGCKPLCRKRFFMKNGCDERRIRAFEARVKLLKSVFEPLR
jgi:hypothetical protein